MGSANRPDEEASRCKGGYDYSNRWMQRLLPVFHNLLNSTNIQSYKQYIISIVKKKYGEKAFLNVLNMPS